MERNMEYYSTAEDSLMVEKDVRDNRQENRHWSWGSRASIHKSPMSLDFIFGT